MSDFAEEVAWIDKNSKKKISFIDLSEPNEIDFLFFLSFNIS